MNLGKNNPLMGFKNLLIAYGVIIVVVLVLLFANILPGTLLSAVWLLVAFLFLTVLTVILGMIMKMLDILDGGNTRLENTAGELEKLRLLLNQVNQSTRLSETAKAIAFRENDAQILREAVFDKLQQKDFDTAYEIIDEIAHRMGYKKLAGQLRVQADKYRDSTDIERMNQSIANVEKLLEERQWSWASAQIERLINEYPSNEKALAMRQRLADRKEERKKVLLNSWDDAVKRQATDRSLEILRELDQYLTPNEALALQEAARDVFRTKLHNLGVQFSLAISGKQWHKALETGMEIIRDFPNSRMAEEIREKIEVLKTHAQQKA
jgi:hypothetical protein